MSLADDLLNEAAKQQTESISILFTDANVAELLAQHLCGKFRHAAGIGWLEWDGMRWRDATDKDVIETARQWVLDKYAEAGAEQLTAMIGQNKEAKSAADALLKGWEPFHSGSRLKTIVGLSAGIAGVTTAPEDFDQHRDLLNTPSGVVDLRTSELFPHDPDLLLRQITHAAYVPGAQHEHWDRALEALPADIIDWYQVVLGQMITGWPQSDDRLIVQQGSGSNGKTTILDAIKAAAGEYYLVLSDKVILSMTGHQHTTELADLMGKRIAVLEETPEDGYLNVNRIKKLVGTERVVARKMRQDNVEFDMIASLVINTNYELRVKETDDGTWRRLLLVRFPYRFVDDKDQILVDEDRLKDPDIRDGLRNDYDGQSEAVLAWVVEGARRWYASGKRLPPVPQRVLDDTLAWRATADRLAGYLLSGEVVADADCFIAVDDLWDQFNGWLEGNGHHTWNKDEFSKKIAAHEQIRKMRAKVGRTRAGRRSQKCRTDDPEGKQYRAVIGLRFASDKGADGSRHARQKRVVRRGE